MECIFMDNIKTIELFNKELRKKVKKFQNFLVIAILVKIWNLLQKLERVRL